MQQPMPRQLYRVEPSRLRPRRLWYGVGAAILVLFAGAGLGLFAYTLYHAASGFHELTGSTRLTLAPERDSTLYATRPGIGAQVGFVATCSLNGPGNAKLRPVAGSETLGRNGTTWYALAHLHVTERGTYVAACGLGPGIRYAIGAKFTVLGLAGGVLGAMGLTMVGFLIAAAIVLVTALRRHGHKQHLVAGATAYGPPPQYGPPGSPPYDPPPPEGTPPWYGPPPHP